MKIAFISGTSIARSNLFDEWNRETIGTPYGDIVARTRGSVIVINRHGHGEALPPHAINHRANIAALKEWKVREAISLNSVGSLQKDLPPGTFVSCSDYVSFIPATFNDVSLHSAAPVIPNRLVQRLVDEFGEPVCMQKTYVQTRGPRFETKAEVRIIRQWGDVVGMTMGSEADLCQEADIGYNSFCIVDNYANGVTDTALSPEAFQRLVQDNRGKVHGFVAHVLKTVVS